jgi:sec-independent protein translocase protein TatB
MFDIGWPEMAVVAVIALIIIGPKDLPRIMRTVGRWAGKARAMARQFQRSIDDMARESDMDDVKKGFDSVSKFNPKKELSNAIDPTGSVKKALESPAADDGDDDKSTKPVDVAKQAPAEIAAESPAAASAETPAEAPAETAPAVTENDADDTAGETPKSQASA